LAEINPLHGTAWDDAAGANSRASLFHGSAWARVLHDTYRFTPLYFAAEQPGAEPAVLCLAEVNSWVTGKRGVGLPFTDECGPLESKGQTFAKLLEHARGLGDSRGWRTLELRGSSEDLPESSHSLGFYKHSLDLSAGLGAISAACDASVRRAIRKAEAAGVRVRLEKSFEAISSYFELHCATRHKHGLPPQPFLFFQNIHRHIIQPGLGFVALAELGEKPVAGAVFFLHKGKSMYKFGGSTPAGEAVRANNLVMWKAIEGCVEKGAKSLDFGRTSCSNEGLRRYKQQWGTRESMLNYLKWNYSARGYMRDTDRSSGWQNRFFRSCPGRISRLLGTLIYPHIA